LKSMQNYYIMNSMKRKIIYITILVLMMSTVAYFYFNKVFLPVKLKGYIEQRASSMFSRAVTIDRVNFVPFKGFVIEKIKIISKDDENKALLEVDEIAFNVLFASFFKAKQIIIPSLNINEPFLQLTHHKENVWNFSDLLDGDVFSKGDSKSNVYIRKINLYGGKVIVKDTSQREEFIEEFDNLNFTSVVNLDQTVNFTFDTHIKKKSTALRLEGVYNLKTKILTSDFLSRNFYAAQYIRFFKDKENIHLKKAVIQASQLNLTYENQQLKIKGAVEIEPFQYQLNKQQMLSGSLKLENLSFDWHNNSLKGQGDVSAIKLKLASDPDKEFSTQGKALITSLFINDEMFLLKGNLTLEAVKAAWMNDQQLSGSIDANKIFLSKIAEDYHLQGDFDIKNLEVKISPEISYSGNVTAKDTIVNFIKGTFEFQSALDFLITELKLAQGKSLKGNISTPNIDLSFNEELFKFKSQLEIKDAEFQFDPDISFKGNPSIALSIAMNPKDKKSLTYNGNFLMTSSSILGLPLIHDIENINGKVIFETNKLNTDELKFKAMNTNVKLNGSLTDFENPMIDAQAASDFIDIKNILPLFPEKIKKADWDLSGEASMKAAYIGLAKEHKKANVKVDARINNAVLSLGSLKEDIKNISGELHYDKDLLTWRPLQGFYRDKKFTLEGHLDDFSRPSIETNVKSDDLSLAAHIKILRKAFQIITLKGNYLNTTYDLKGDVHLFDDADPDLDLKGTVVLELLDLPVFAPQFKEKIDNLELSGIITAEGLYRGKIKDWRNWQLKFEAQVPMLSIKDYHLDQVFIKYEQRDENISQCDITSVFYGGQLKLDSTADLIDDAIPLKGDLTLDNIDLAVVKKELDLKNENLAGNLMVAINFNSSLKNFDQLKGRGAISISEGYLWRLKILEGLLGTFLIPEFKSSVFTNGKASFRIEDQRVLTEDAFLASQSIELRAKGWIDFNKNINMNVTPHFSEITIAQSESLKKGTTALLAQIIEIKLTGTLDKPSYQVESSPIKILDNTKDILIESVGTILEEIFN